MDFEQFLKIMGSNIFQVFDQQDSGCFSFGYEFEDKKYFVKYAKEENGIRSLKNAILFHQKLKHPNLIPLINAFTTKTGIGLVYPWVNGEGLYTPASLRESPASAYSRFRQLPLAKKRAVIDTIYTVHRQIVAAGFVAVDFYDGSLLYDFERASLYLCDVDEYRPGPFTLVEERLPGSTRFMAPEEFVKGSAIDERTNIFTMGRLALEFLGRGQRDIHFWEGSEAMFQVIHKATQPAKKERYASYQAFLQAWTSACNYVV